MTTQEQLVRTYNEKEWAVRRWDALHAGRIVEPKSFCQFWRTVFLWCTLMQVPFIGSTFVEREREPPPDRWVPGEPREPSRAAKFIAGAVHLAGQVVWWGPLLPLRGIWYAFASVVEYLHDRPRIGAKLKDWLQTIVDVLVVIIAVVTAIGLVVAALVATYLYLPDVLDLGFDYWTYLFAGMLGWGLFLYLVITRRPDVVFFAEGIIDFLVKVLTFIWSIITGFFRAIGSIIHLVIDIAITNKKHICPPMEIRRSNG